MPSVKSEPGVSTTTLPDGLLELRATDEYLQSIADAVPVPLWGFDDEVHKLIADRKHELMDDKLTPRQHKHLNARKKRQLVRADPNSHLNTVTDVWKLIKDSKQLSRKQLMTDKKLNEKQAAAETKAAASKRSAPNSTKKNGRKRKREKRLAALSAAGESGTSTLASGTSASARMEAIARLTEKLALMKAARSTDSSSATDLQDLARLKRRISKLNFKERRAAGKSKNKASKVDAAAETNGKADVKSEVKSELKAEDAAGNPPIRNQEGKMVYNKFDFVLSAGARAALLQNVSAKGKKKGKGADGESMKKGDKLKGKDYKTLLDKVEARQRKVDKWKERDPEKAARLEQNIKWSDAMQRADGDVVKNDPVKLKQSLKNKEKTKESKKRKWDDRVKSVKDQQQAKQDKRKHNINKRKDMKIKNKLNKAARKR